MRVVCALVVLATLGASCTGGSDDAVAPASSAEVTTSVATTDPGPSFTEVEAPDLGDGTAYEQLVVLEGSGASALEVALVELAALTGPLPGVPTIENDGTIFPSLTHTITTIRAGLDDLDGDRGAAVEERIDRLLDPTAIVATLEVEYEDADEPQGFARPVTAQSLAAAGTSDDDLPPCPPGVVGSRPPGTTAPSTAPADEVDPREAVNERWVDLFDEQASRFRSEFPGSLSYVVAVTDPRIVDTGNAGAITLTDDVGFIDDRVGVLRSCFGQHDCYILIADESAIGATAVGIATHEMFHCWHFRRLDRESVQYDATPNWASEGMASWVGEHFAGGSEYGEGYWRLYFNGAVRDPGDTRETGAIDGLYSLYDSKYTAIGFWSHIVNGASTSPDRLFLSILRGVPVGGSASAANETLYRRVLEVIGDETIRTIAAAATQDRALGAEWTMTGPGIISGGRTIPEITVREGGVQEINAPPGIELAKRFDFDVDPSRNYIVRYELEFRSHMTWNDDTTSSVDDEILTDSRCIGRCVCPDGTLVPTSPGDLDPMDAEVTVALNGGPAATSRFRVALEPLEDSCEDAPAPQRSESGRSPGRGGSYGHPNVVTFDGIGYVFHGAGDYVITESGSGDFAVHARYSRLNRMTGVSFNRAVAALVGDSVVTFGDDAESTVFGPAVVRVDGDVVDPDAAEIGVGGSDAEPAAVLFGEGERFVLRWQDGSELRVGRRIGDQFDLMVARPRWGDVVGLLGNANGDRYDDLATRAGTPADPRDFESLYGEFGASWLLDPPDSLFASTLDPVDIEPIVPSAWVTLADLPQADRDRAEAICRDAGVLAGAGLTQCMFDVVMTGSVEWVAGVLAMEEIAGDAVAPGAIAVDVEDRSTITELESEAVLDGSLDEPGAIDLFEVELPARARLEIDVEVCPQEGSLEVALVLTDPSDLILGRTTGSDCGRFDFGRLGLSGTYEIRVSDTSGFTGDYSITLLRGDGGESDVVAPGETHEFVVESGSPSAALTFDGTVGQRVRFERDDGGFNAGFASFQLLDPQGNQIDSWSSTDSNEVTIVADGVHSVVLDIMAGSGAGSIDVTLVLVDTQTPHPIVSGEQFEMAVASSSDVAVATFDASAGDRLTVTADADDDLISAAASFRLIGPNGTEIDWWFVFRDGDVTLEADGTYVLAFDSGTAEGSSIVTVVATVT